MRSLVREAVDGWIDIDAGRGAELAVVGRGVGLENGVGVGGRKKERKGAGRRGGAAALISRLFRLGCSNRAEWEWRKGFLFGASVCDARFGTGCGVGC